MCKIYLQVWFYHAVKHSVHTRETCLIDGEVMGDGDIWEFAYDVKSKCGITK